MLHTKSVNDEIVAVSWAPTEICLRAHGKDQYGLEQQLLQLCSDGTLRVNRNVAD